MAPLPLAVVALTSLILGVAGALLVTRWRGVGRSASPSSAPIKAVADHIPVAVLLHADNGLIRFANDRAAELLFAGEPLAGRNLLRLLAQAPASVREPLSASGDVVFTLEHDGARETFQLLRRPLELDGRAHTLLLVNPLTRELEARELAVLKKVIRVISHELNNSLSSMSSFIGSARYIAEHPSELTRLGRVLDGLEERTSHLRRFLGEYATLARLPEPRKRAIEWAPLLDRLARMFPELELDAPPQAPGWFDEAQVEQALINLLKNASEAAPDARPRLLLRETDVDLEIGVLDEGPGFSDEALEFGLLPFFTTKPSGSGLGLALCREIAEGHGGSLRIKRRERGGAAVSLVLPRREPARARAATAALSLTST
ncbi:MAG: HAMP domain-containing histidine kinase [Myxococcales bacterium]|nr:HAMP domain-containing histidine kinase [Myxococcales bacterium]